MARGLSIAVSRQVIPRGDELNLTVREFFEGVLSKFSREKVYDVDPRIDNVLSVINFEAPHGRLIKSFSGDSKLGFF